jgi:uncharacterized membrane protein
MPCGFVHAHILPSVSRYEWLLFLHVTGAFLFLGGVVVAWVLGIATARRARPSEIALLMGLTGTAAAAIGLGLILTLVFGLWLVFDLDGYELWDGWIIAAIVMWVLSGALGGAGGKRDKETRLLAERLAAEGDTPSAELSARVRDPVALSLNVASSLLGFAILALMIWKPGAGG